ncbi:MAG: hypothetical protein WD042_03065 [Phycisphaeraceae bacterium]
MSSTIEAQHDRLASQFDVAAGLLLDLSEILRDSPSAGRVRWKMTHDSGIRERLRIIEAAGDPLHLVEQLRSMLNNRATLAQDAAQHRTP